MSSFPAATITRAAKIIPRASTGAVMAITANETTSFVVKAFMRSFLTPFPFLTSRRVRCFANNHVLYKERATGSKSRNVNKHDVFDQFGA
jgi:hypothetical protein